MPKSFLRTSDIAGAVGVHPNTVRAYEAWGFLPPIPRTHTGYRLFTERHLDQMRLARLVFGGEYTGDRSLAVAGVRAAARGEFDAAEGLFGHYLEGIRARRAQAEAAVEFLEAWAQGRAVEEVHGPLRIGEAARRVGATRDMLRGWDRDGLLAVPRDPHTGHRLYGAAEIGRLRVLHMLRSAGYSLMAIKRMVLDLDRGRTEDLRATLDRPRPGDEVFAAADHWLSSLAAQDERALGVIAHLRAMGRRHGGSGTDAPEKVT